MLMMVWGAAVQWGPGEPPWGWHMWWGAWGIGMPLSADRLRLKASGGRVRVIEPVPGQIVTRAAIGEVSVVSGEIRPDPAQDLLKLAVLERHGKNGNVGLGLVRGFGLREGALASSIAHDSHNLIAVGVDDRDLLAALEEVIRMGGRARGGGGGDGARLPGPARGGADEP